MIYNHVYSLLTLRMYNDYSYTLQCQWHFYPAIEGYFSLYVSSVLGRLNKDP